MKLLSRLACVIALLLPIAAFAGQVTGQIQTPTGGAVSNGTLTFTLSQPAILSGTAMVVPSTVSCYTSSTGNVVGLPDPLTVPIMATNTLSGTLPAGTYYVKIAYTGTPGDSIASPEGIVTLSGAGTVIVNAPTVQPASATGYKVFIGNTSGSESLQGTVTGWTNYSQSAALSAGSAPPSTNASVCSIRFSDELIPTGTYYSVNLLSKSGSQYAGYPQTWCTYGGSGATINVSQGAPTGNCGTSGVYYPTPVLASQATPQSLAGPLSAPEFDGNVNILSGTSNFNIVNASQFIGALTGNVVGSLTGNAIGNLSAPAVGAFTITARSGTTASGLAITGGNASAAAGGSITLAAGSGTPTGGSIALLPGPGNIVLIGTTVGSYNGSPTVGNGIAVIRGTINQTAQSANIPSSPLLAVGSGLATGQYRVSAYIVVTTAATTSSTLPSVVITWTDADNGTSQSLTLTSTSTGNTLSTYAQATAVISASNTANVTYSTTGYASVGATALQYAIHLRIEAL